jgi:hypothetical protein
MTPASWLEAADPGYLEDFAAETMTDAEIVAAMQGIPQAEITPVSAMGPNVGWAGDGTIIYGGDGTYGYRAVTASGTVAGCSTGSR